MPHTSKRPKTVIGLKLARSRRTHLRRCRSVESNKVKRRKLWMTDAEEYQDEKEDGASSSRVCRSAENVDIVDGKSGEFSEMLEEGGVPGIIDLENTQDSTSSSTEETSGN
ncbi:unnamed protein product [Mesocestoides corti]|uniref:Uncharacterized protein n=1 Tax=Mesocestoides corti TaxID=53468 RepID=A0A0R3U6T9_MESCO|nr:unnamed protein product [Mesocestoides corti]